MARAEWGRISGWWQGAWPFAPPANYPLTGAEKGVYASMLASCIVE